MPCRSRTLLALVSVLVCHCAATSSSADGGPAATDAGITATLAPTASPVTASPATGVFADGVTVSTITIQLVDTTGAPMPGVPLTLSATGSNNTITQPGVTDRNGMTSGTIASTIAETKTITASIADVALPQQPTVDFVPGPASQLAFRVGPSSAISGQAIAPAVLVAVEDSQGRPITSGELNVTMKLARNTTGGKLSGTLVVPVSNGVATFSDLLIDKIGTYTLSASATGLTSATSGPLQIAPGPASQITFVQQPTAAKSQAPISPSIVVALHDAAGNLTEDATTVVSLELGSGTAHATLTGTLSETAAAGQATFTGISINLIGTYTLKAIAATFSVTSDPFVIAPGAAARMTFTQEPESTKAGSILLPVAVTLTDAAGNTVDDSSTRVTVALGTGVGATGLAGTTTETATHGVAAFTDLSLTRVGSFTLNATALGYEEVASANFSISSGAPAALQFTVQPTNVGAGAAFSPVVQVTLRDGWGNTIADSATAVTLALGTNLGGGVLSGSATQTAFEGVVSFPALSVNKAASGYTLIASATGYPSATSQPFAVSASHPAALVFTAAPLGATAGVAVAPALQVTLEDQFGNAIPDSNTYVALAVGAGPTGGTLSGTTTRAASNGVATFTDVVLTVSGTYTLTASAAGYGQAISGSFTVQPGHSSALRFSVQPSEAAAGGLFSPAVQVTLQDAFGNTTADSTTKVTLTIGANPSGGMLSGTTTRTAVNGVATFADLRIASIGAGYTLTTSAPGYVGATSNAFDITSALPSTLVFTAVPSSLVAGDVMKPAVQVRLEDQFGNTIPDSSTTVTLSLGSNPTGATLLGTLQQTASGGVVTFSDLSMTVTGLYSLSATAAGYNSATSGSFIVKPAAPSMLLYSAQPTDTIAGKLISPAVQVTLQDRFANTIVDATTPVTLAFGANPGPGTLTGTLSQPPLNGVATFFNLSITTTGIGYTLVASATGYPNLTSAPFTIKDAGPAALVFTAPPSGAIAGVTIAPAVQINLEDKYGNTIPDSSTTVTVALETNAGGGTLFGTLTQTAGNGVATFPDLSLQKAGVGYTLVASANAFPDAISAPFDIAVAAPATLVFTVPPPATTNAGATITPAIQMTLEDQFENTIPDSTTLVTLLLGSNPSGGILHGTQTQRASNGIATFPDLSIQQAGSGYSLVALAGGYPIVSSNPFSITVGVPAALAFTVQPSGASAGVTLTPAIQVTLEDVYGNTLPDSTTTVTLALDANPSGGTLLGTLTQMAANGVATFPDLSLQKAGPGYTLSATATAYGMTVSNAFNIGPAPFTPVFTVQPTSVGLNQPITPAIQVTVKDAFGNPDNTTVTLQLGHNAGSTTLVGTTTVSTNNGVASFTGLSLGARGIAYTLIASLGDSPTTVVSQPFNVIGTGWYPIGGAPTGDPTALAVATWNPGELFIGTTNGLYQSTTAGATWQATAIMNGPILPQTLVTCGSSTIYTIVNNPTGPTLYASQNGGTSWSATVSQSWLSTVNLLAADPTACNFLYAGLNTGTGTYSGLQVSYNGGYSWEPLNYGVDQPVTAFAVATGNGNVLYQGGVNDDAWFSSGGGFSWSPITFFGSQTWNGLAVSPQNPATVFAACGTGLFESPNNGGSWTAATGITGNVSSVAIDPVHPTNVYAFGSGLSKSVNGGTSFTLLSNTVVEPFTLDATGQVLLAATSGNPGVVQSTNAGSTFAAVPWGVGGTISSFAWAPETPGTLLVGTGVSPDAAYLTYDSGAHWSEVYKSSSSDSVTAVAIDPNNDHVLYLANGVLFRSTDQGMTWNDITASSAELYASVLLINQASGIRLGGNFGFAASDDGGATWRATNSGLGNGEINSMIMDATTPTTLYAGNSTGLYVSTDDGHTWAPAGTGLPGTQVNGIVQDSGAPANLYAATASGLYMSPDHAMTWTALTATATSAVTLSAGSPPTLFEATAAGVSYSVNNGASWNPVTSLPAGSTVSALTIDPNLPATVVAVTSYGLWEDDELGQ